MNTAGLIADDRANSPIAFTLPLVTNGGTVTIDSYSAYLAQGSTIDVSGGIYINSAEIKKILSLV